MCIQKQPLFYHISGQDVLSYQRNAPMSSNDVGLEEFEVPSVEPDEPDDDDKVSKPNPVK